MGERKGDLLLKFMDTFKLASLHEATVEQLSEYIAKHPVQKSTETELGPSL